jgi:hypothetical protein
MGARRKPADQLLRRNKPARIVQLSPEKDPLKKAPALAAHPPGGGEWHELVLSFWRDLWSSPMASQYLRVDIMGLQILAYLLQDFYTSRTPSGSLVSEIRSLLRAYGLTPDDRRSGLDWVVQDPPDHS